MYTAIPKTGCRAAAVGAMRAAALLRSARVRVLEGLDGSGIVSCPHFAAWSLHASGANLTWIPRPALVDADAALAPVAFAGGARLRRGRR